MIRVVSSLAIVVGLTSSANADDRIRIAILGLDVSGPSDFESTTIARNLTGGLRGQVRNAPRFQVAPNSNKELIDEKLATGCDSEALACMAKIGKKLGARVLLYGRIAKTHHNGVEGYQLTLHLLDAESQLATPYATWIPLADTTGSELDGWAAKVFLHATAGEAVAAVPLKEPRRALVPAKPGAGWRATSYVSTGAALVLGGAYVFAWQQKSTGNSDAGGWNRALTYTTGPLALAAAGLAIYATYKGFISSGEAAEHGVVGGPNRKRTRFAVTPIVSPDGAGATVRLDW